MKKEIRKKLQDVGFKIIRKYAYGDSKTGERVITEVLPNGKMRLLKRYNTKAERDAAFKTMLEAEDVLAG